MSVQSMTGYGSGENSPYRVEIRGTNQRNLDVQLKAGQGFLPVETRIRERVKELFHRGRLEIFVRQVSEAGTVFRVNGVVAGSFVAALRDLKGRFELAGEPDVATVASLREVFTFEEVEADAEAFWPAFEQALGELRQMREDEGATLVRDVLSRTVTIESGFDRIGARSGEIRAGLTASLRQRVSDLLGDVPLDEARLAQEIVFYADRSDITEELVRVKSHLEQVRGVLRDGGPVGKKLDFLCQEILRETNTVGSKCSDSRIAHEVVEIKTEIEKIREQLQNLE